MFYLPQFKMLYFFCFLFLFLLQYSTVTIHISILLEVVLMFRETFLVMVFSISLPSCKFMADDIYLLLGASWYSSRYWVDQVIWVFINYNMMWLIKKLFQLLQCCQKFIKAHNYRLLLRVTLYLIEQHYEIVIEGISFSNIEIIAEEFSIFGQIVHVRVIKVL